MRADNLQLTFADLELMRQGIEMDPVLKQISAYVDQHPELIDAVNQQLNNRVKKSRTGRPGLTRRRPERVRVLPYLSARAKSAF